MGQYIYKKGLPSFKKYDLFDYSEESWELTLKDSLFKGKGIRDISTLYIKGIDMIEDKEKKIDCRLFFNDYIELGKKLYELSTTEHTVCFLQNYEFDYSTLVSNYIEKHFLELCLTDEQTDYINCIMDKRDKFLDILGNDKDYYEFLDLIDGAIDLLYLLWYKLDYDIDKYLIKLLDILKKHLDKYNSVNNKKIGKLFLVFDCKNDLVFLYNEIKEIVNTNNIKLEKEVALSIAKKSTITKIDILNRFEEAPLVVRFTFDQFDDLKKIIIEFLEKYGFPYYIDPNDEDKFEYRFIINRDLKKEEKIIPADILILCSVYTYLLHSILENWDFADNKIKEIWGFKDKNLKSKKIKSIHEIRKRCKYFNNNISGRLFSFKGDINSDEVHDRFFKDKDSYDKCDNYFKSDKDNCYSESTIYNLCVAANEVMEKEYRYDEIDDKIKKCLVCGKEYYPSKKLYKFCSEDCKEIWTRDRKKKNQQNKRMRDKNKGIKREL